MNKLESMHDLYVNLLQDTYNAEKQLLKALHQMAESAVSPQMKARFFFHAKETVPQLERLEAIFEILSVKGDSESCAATEGLVHEAKEYIYAEIDAKIRDAGLIVTAQKIAHYEIASYDTLCRFARFLGLTSHINLLEKTYAEEIAHSEQLTLLTQGSMSRMAQAA